MKPLTVGFLRGAGGIGDTLRAVKVREAIVRAGCRVVDIEVNSARPGGGNLWTLATWRNLVALATPGSPMEKVNRVRANESVRWLVRYRHENTRRIVDSELRGIDILHAETPPWVAVACEVARVTGLPLVIGLHGFYGVQVAREGAAPGLARFWDEVEQEAVARTQAVIVHGEKIKAALRCRHPSAKVEVVVAENGSDIPPRTARYEQPARVAYCGAFDVFEGIMLFPKIAEAMDHESSEFVLIGDGEMRGELLDYINSHGVPITYLGRRPPEQALDLLSSMQVGVATYTPSAPDRSPQAPDHWEVNSCMKAIAYAAAGLPSVLPPTGETVDNFRAYDAAVFVTEPSVEAYVAALRELAEQDVWRAKAANARRLAEEQYRWEKVMQPVVDYYRGLG
ncbi:MAG: glycosyltransferase [Armatimonadota bacterium]